MDVPAAAGVSAAEPLVFWVPLHAPLAVQDVALVELQVKVVLLPSVTLLGEAVTLTVGAAAFGALPPPLQATGITLSAAPSKPSRRRARVREAEEQILPENTCEIVRAVLSGRPLVIGSNIDAVPPPATGFTSL